jgi:hypothetical protein
MSEGVFIENASNVYCFFRILKFTPTDFVLNYGVCFIII